MRECDDLRSSRDEAINSSKETEKKLKSMEADALRFQEVLRVVNRHRAVWLVTFCHCCMCKIRLSMSICSFQDLASADRLKRQIQTERDELQDEMNDSNNKK